MKTRLVKVDRFLNYKIACWSGRCPKPEEIQNPEVGKLASRLKGSSYKETLTNILDWEGRNIVFWTERHPLETLLGQFVVLSMIIGVFVFFGLIIFVALIYHSLNLLLTITTWYTPIWITIMLTGVVLILAIMIQIIHSNRKIPILEGLRNAFSFSININFLLEKKLGVCRDSAKLTASLLLNIYPDAEIYFASAPSHIATGIVVENRLYMLDQRLPILTIDGWKKYRHLEGKLHKLGNTSIEEVDPKGFLSKTGNISPDKQTLAKLTQTMLDLLKIKEQTNGTGDLLVTVRLKKGMSLYQDDELVNYSLSRWLQAKISSELIDMNQIAKIEVTSEKEDIIFRIYLGLKLLSANKE